MLPDLLDDLRPYWGIPAAGQPGFAGEFGDIMVAGKVVDAGSCHCTLAERNWDRDKAHRMA
jgi:hypothetical protein